MLVVAVAATTSATTACVGWRQTGRCDPRGPREPEGDRSCDAIIKAEASGFCDCGHKRPRVQVACNHAAFRCSQACATPAAKPPPRVASSPAPKKRHEKHTSLTPKKHLKHPSQPHDHRKKGDATPKSDTTTTSSTVSLVADAPAAINAAPDAAAAARLFDQSAIPQLRPALVSEVRATVVDDGVTGRLAADATRGDARTPLAIPSGFLAAREGRDAGMPSAHGGSRGNATSHLNFLSRLPPVPCREDLAQFAERYFARTRNAAEIGVFQGHFSQHNLKYWKGTYVAIDAWDFRPGDPEDKNFRDRATNERNFDLFRSKTARYRSRVRVVRNLSVQAAAMFEDAHFDWVYIDALHTKDALLADLHAWWPKVRPGGLVAGDDYGDARPNQLVGQHKGQDGVPDFERPNLFWSIPSQSDWGVMRATDEFAREVGAVLLTTFMLGHGLLETPTTCYLWPAWYLVKPYADQQAASWATPWP